MIQLTSSVTSNPAGRRPTFFTDEKSTFIIIGVIISQIRTAMGALIWLPLPELNAAQARDEPGQQFTKQRYPATMQSATHTER